MRTGIESLGIVILNYNNYILTKSLVETLMADAYFSRAKIVVVDNMSTNESYEVLKEAFKDQVPVIQSGKNGGYAYGNNTGIRYLKEQDPQIKYCAICNPDVLLKESSIEAMLELMEKEPEIKLLGCKAIEGDGREAKYCWKLPSARYEIFSSEFLCNKLIAKTGEYTKQELDTEVTYVDVVLGAFFIAEMDALFEVGLLGEDTFLYCEEQILSYKLKQKGYEIAVMNTCEFIHNHKEPENLRGKVKNFSLHQRSKRVYLKNYLHVNAAVLLLFDLFHGIGLMERKIVSLFWR